MQVSSYLSPLLHARDATLSFPRDAQESFGVCLQTGSKSAPSNDDGFCAPTPLAIEIVTGAGDARWIFGAYKTVIPAGTGTVLCGGEIVSANGSVFRFTDRYTVAEGGDTFQLSRIVLVATVGKGDAGFSSRFGLRAQKPMQATDAEFFVPGVWYKDNANVPLGALAANQNERVFLFREDRLPLPLIALRRKRGGLTLALHHVGGVPATFLEETGRKRIIDARMQFGAAGFLNDGTGEAVFTMPGTEGERTYIGRKSPDEDTWARRSHPVITGFTHRYTLRFSLGVTPDFASTVRQTWRAAVASAKPPVIKADLNRVYHVSGELLNTYCHKYDGVISVPFQARVPSGEVIDTSSQMGFVGQALPSAALLLRWGHDTLNADAVARASEVVDFWAKNGIAENGVPRNWYDIRKDSTFTWRNYPLYLRVASDGACGMLAAWNTARKARIDKPEWLRFCKRYGDWLVQAQNADGSFYRSYEITGAPRDKRLDTTTHPIAFLCDLFCATGDIRYRMAALKAGAYCLSSVHCAYSYVGGTPDNPNVTDKEAGMIALHAFLALHDVSGGDVKWLHCAVQAAWFSDSWVYQWNVPLPPGATSTAFPPKRTTHGLSLIATGHSGADNYMASAPFLYYRLYLLTGDAFFRDAAHRLMHNTKQLLNWDGALGYQYPGLLTEAVNLTSPRGKGVRGWLPWLTVAVMEPMVRLRDVFGAWDIAQIEKQPRRERLRRNTDFARYRGFIYP